MDGARRYSGRVTTPRFAAALNAQIGNEFAAHLQYIAVAVHFDALTMPRMASFFYQQAREERDHAMMMVRHLPGRGSMGSSSRSNWRSPRSER